MCTLAQLYLNTFWINLQVLKRREVRSRIQENESFTSDIQSRMARIAASDITSVNTCDIDDDASS